MKKSILLLGVFLALFSCQEQDSVDPIIPVQDGTASRAIPNGDPNLNANFNWDTSSWTVYFTNGNGNVSSAISTNNPFHTDDIYGSSVSADQDYKASQGWMLVARDFGTPTSAPTIPWILLYNKYRGLLRLCAFRTSLLGTSYQSTEVFLDNSTTIPDLFEFADDPIQIATTESGNQEWMVSEFNLQGYESSIHQQARLKIKFREITNFSLALNGNVSLSGKAQPKPKKRSVSGTVYDVSTHSSKIWSSIGQFGKDNFKNKVTFIAKNALGITGGVGGLVKSLTSSGTAPTYNISLEGNVSLDGNMTQTTPVGSVEVFLRHDANRGTQAIALQSIPWGVMNYNSAVTLTNEEIMTGGGGGEEEDDGNIVERVSTSSGFFNNILVTNPSITSSISTIEAGWVIAGQDNIVFRTQSAFQSIGYFKESAIGTQESFKIPEAVAIRITYSNGDIVYNRIPIQYNYIYL
ncbi:MAG: hypothetical protein Roseis2KO_54940 [Roseivirga sp.]